MAFHRNALQQLVVVRLRPRCCRGFNFVRGGHHGTSARTPTNRRAEFACARNTGSARHPTIDIPQQVRSCRWDESRLQHSRRRIAFCQRLTTTGTTRSLQHKTNLAMEKSGDGCIPPRVLSKRGDRTHPSLRSMTTFDSYSCSYSCSKPKRERIDYAYEYEPKRNHMKNEL
jgi:hypothetical protein